MTSASRYGLTSAPHTCDEPHRHEGDAIEVTGTGQCAKDHPVIPLADRIAERLTEADIGPNHPEMNFWRAWNKRAAEKAAGQ